MSFYLFILNIFILGQINKSILLGSCVGRPGFCKDPLVDDSTQHTNAQPLADVQAM